MDGGLSRRLARRLAVIWMVVYLDDRINHTIHLNLVTIRELRLCTTHLNLVTNHIQHCDPMALHFMFGCTHKGMAPSKNYNTEWLHCSVGCQEEPELSWLYEASELVSSCGFTN